MLYQQQFKEWKEEFKSNIKTLNKSATLYIVNKELFSSKNKFGNFNSKIVDNNNEIDEEKIFVIINEHLWSKIKIDFPNEKEIKISGNYENKKYVFRINDFIYYFYHINDLNHLIEGYFRFELRNKASEIFSKFISSNFNDFINEYNININSNELQVINFNGDKFFFKRKTDNKNNNNNNINNNPQFNNFGNFGNNNNQIFNNVNNNRLFPNVNNQNNFKNNKIPRNPNNNININNFNNFNNFNPNQMKIPFNMPKNNQIKRRANSAGRIRNNINQPIIPRKFVVGLNNVGATCYMNATLQCLVHVEKLTKHLLKPEMIQMIQGNKNRYILTDAYLNVLINSWMNVNINNYSPNYFKQVISVMNPLFEGIQANDSKDLIIFLMEKMHSELNIPLNNQNLQQNNQMINQYDFKQSFKSFKKYFANNYRSVISNLFYGFFDSIMYCKNCQALSHNIQCYNILIFPLEEVRIFKQRQQNIVSIEECFQYYQKKDLMSGANQIYCNKCHQNSDSINYSKLIACPNILVVNLNRGKGLQFDIKIDFDDTLDVKNYLMEISNDIPTVYKIFGIVTHFGPSSMSGHFIAFCKSFVDGKWYKCNDSMVTPSSFYEAKNTGVPYILFYSGSKN